MWAHLPKVRIMYEYKQLRKNRGRSSNIMQADQIHSLLESCISNVSGCGTIEIWPWV